MRILRSFQDRFRDLARPVLCFSVGLMLLHFSASARAEESFIVTAARKAEVNSKRQSYPWAEESFQAVRKTGSQTGILGSGAAISYVTVNARAHNTFAAALVWRLTGDESFAERAVAALTDWKEKALGRAVAPYGYLGDPPAGPLCAQPTPDPLCWTNGGTGPLALVKFAVQHMAMAYDLLRDYPLLHQKYSPAQWSSFFSALSAPSGGRFRSGMDAAVAIAQKSGSRAAKALAGFHSEVTKLWDESEYYTNALSGFEYGAEYVWFLGMTIKLIGMTHEMGLVDSAGSELSLSRSHNHLFYRVALGGMHTALPNGKYGVPTLGDDYPDSETSRFFAAKSGYYYLPNGVYELASSMYPNYPEHRFLLWICSIGDRNHYIALLWGPDSLETTEPPRGRSVLLGKRGAVLKSVSEDSYWNSNSTYALLSTTHSPSGAGHHSHTDTLSLVLFGDQKAQMVDLGRKGPGGNWWGWDTVDHALVTVNGANQSRISNPTATFFNDTSLLRVAQISAPDAYASLVTDYRRTVGVLPEYVIDIFKVACPVTRPMQWRTIGWGDYTFSGLSLASGGAPAGAALSSVKHASVDEGLLFEVDTGMRSHVLGRTGTEVFSASVDLLQNLPWPQFPSYSTKCRTVILKRSAATTVFSAVHDLVPYDVTSVAAWRDDNEAVVLEVTGSGFRDVFAHSISSSGSFSVQNPADALERISWDGPYGFVRRSGTELHGFGYVSDFNLLAPQALSAAINDKAVVTSSTDGYVSYSGGLVDAPSILPGSVVAANNPPTVEAGPTQRIVLPQNVVNLHGVVTDDGVPEGSTLAVQWTRLSGPAEVTFADGSQAVTDATFSSPGTYSLKLSADDGALQSSDDTRVTVLDATPTLEDEVLAHWPLDQCHVLDAIAYDTSGQNRDGSIHGAELTPGAKAEALSFDGVTDRVSVPDFDFGPGFSIAFWFRSNSNAGDHYQYLWSHGDSSGPHVAVYLLEDGISENAGVLRTSVRDGNDEFMPSALDVPTGLADGLWHHYCLVVAPDSGSTVFIDGQPRSTAMQGGDAINPDGPSFWGTRQDQDPDRFFVGTMDEIWFLGRPLAPQEALQLKESVVPSQEPPDAGPNEEGADPNFHGGCACRNTDDGNGIGILPLAGLALFVLRPSRTKKRSRQKVPIFSSGSVSCLPWI